MTKFSNHLTNDEKCNDHALTYEGHDGPHITRRGNCARKLQVRLSYSLGTACAPLGAVIGFSQAMAQTADTTVDGGDFIVTATRSKDALSRVQITVQAFGAESLDRRTVHQVDEIARLNLGLVLNRRSSGASNVAICNISPEASYATTAAYIDDFPIQVGSLGFSSSTQFPIVFDLERVEVLRGPQGTLLGAGSECGTFRFLQPAPNLTKIQTYVRSELSFTNSGSASYEFGAAFGAPIIEGKLTFRISGNFRRDGGWIDRAARSLVVLDPTGANIGSSAVFTPSGERYKNSNWQNSIALRGAIPAKLSHTLKATVSGNYHRLFNDGNVTGFWAAASNPEVSSFVAPLFRQGISTDANQLTNMNVETFDALSNKFSLTSLALELAPGNAVLNSTTANFDASKIQWSDRTPAYGAIYAGIDYPDPGWQVTSHHADSRKNFTQELRLQSVRSGESRLPWVLSGYYSHAIQNSVPEISANLFRAINSYFGIPSLDNGEPFGHESTKYQNVLGVDLLRNSVSYDVRLRVVDEQIAGFGQVDYKMFNGLTVTASMRISRNAFNFMGFCGGPENNLNAPFGAPCTTGKCIYQDPNVEFASAFSGGTSSQVETSSIPKFTVSHQVGRNNLICTTASGGFCPVGGQVQLSAQCRADLAAFGYIDANRNPAAPMPYKSESLWNYEIGSTYRFFGDRLLINRSAYIKWKDTQDSLPLRNCGYQFTANLANATASVFANNILIAHPFRNYSGRFNGAPVWTAYIFRPRTVGIPAMKSHRNGCMAV